MVSGAQAEGVVFESTIADYKLGQIIASGEAIELPAGEHVKILSRDGEQIVIRETSIYDADNAEDEASSQPSAFEIAIWNKRRADIGGTRGDRFEQCLEAAEKDPTLEEADCEQLVGADQAAPTFEISNTSVRSALRPSQDLRVKMVSDFNAIASCQIQRADQSAETTELRLGTQGKRTTRMLAGTPKHIPQRGVPAPKAPEQAGEYTLTCLAISSAAVDLFGTAMEGAVAHADRDLLTARFAEIRGEPVALGSLTFTVSDE